MKKLLVFCLVVGLLGCKKEAAISTEVNPLLYGTWEQITTSSSQGYAKIVSFDKEGLTSGFGCCCQFYTKFTQQNNVVVLDSIEISCYCIFACETPNRYNILSLSSTELVLGSGDNSLKFKRKM